MPKKSTKKKVKLERGDDSNPFLDQFNQEWDEKEKDMIFGLYGSEEHSLGVVRTIYSGLPSLERTMAIRRDSNVYGLPLNKIFELFGVESSGKSSLGLYLCVQFILNSGLAYFVDFEHKFDPAWLRKIATMNGLPVELLKKRFRYVDPKHFEGFLSWLLRFMKRVIAAKTLARKTIIELEKKKKKAKDHEEQLRKQKQILATPFIIVVDSIAAIYTKQEMEKKELSESQVAELAGILNKCLKRIRYYLGYTDCLIIGLNQIRDNIQTNQFLAKFASKIRTPGGNAWKHFSDCRLQISTKGRLKRTRDKVEYNYGSIHGVRVVKNQMGVPPFLTSDLIMLNDRGFSSMHSILDVLASVGKVRRKGNEYTFAVGGERHDVLVSEVDEHFKEYPKHARLLHKVYKEFMLK